MENFNPEASLKWLQDAMGAGLSMASGGDSAGQHPSGPPQHEGMSEAERAFSAGATFLSGILSISASQFIGAPLKLINPEYFDAYMAFTKQSFGVLITAMTQWWAPTVVRVSGDESMKGQLIQEKDGTLRCNFPHRIVVMANHQLYTDWLYLWWIAYTNNMHGRIYIVLKESLKKIPIVGWGAQFYNFIFLARNWEKDESRFREHLAKLNDPADPMWLLLFPEGTNLAAGTREKSRKWAEKNGIPDMKHQLLPRSTGLRFCLQELKNTTEWLYDCTIAYEGIPPGEYGQDVYTLRSSFLEGRPPKSVNMHWRRFKIADIPTDSEKAFEVWLRNRWTEKDHFLEYYVKHGHFPAHKPWVIAETANPRPAKAIETQVKSKNWEEFLSIFAPLGAFVTVLFLFYGVNKNQLPSVEEAAKFAKKQGSARLTQQKAALNSIAKSAPSVASQANKPPTTKASKSPTTKAPTTKALKVPGKPAAVPVKAGSATSAPAKKAAPQGKPVVGAAAKKPQANGAVKPSAPQKLATPGTPNSPRKLERMSSTSTMATIPSTFWKPQASSVAGSSAAGAPKKLLTPSTGQGQKSAQQQTPVKKAPALATNVPVKPAGSGQAPKIIKK